MLELKLTSSITMPFKAGHLSQMLKKKGGKKGTKESYINNGSWYVRASGG